ncbi:FAD-binding protein [Nocardioides sp. ChNu-153]|uniref:D-arabinono-1,4-lactone oxidase n=1 Tax=unclassified Nocardioides TaxID=2615069 RepID=UPI00240652DB|nr:MULTISPECIES: D-arabinono-1,4-lactone oxidase [unclassified Nocardioides]MDF9717898.1 FAD-binding protein [Nocardioides sp. ChNu-99]MDN7121213.1 FAD-binding protein [Nocardioides sp. ChNu-153]
MGAASWSNWAGTATAHPATTSTPRDVGDVVAAVHRARSHGSTVRMVGTGHSFTDVALTDGELLHPEGLVGVVDVDRAAMTVTVLAGTPLKVLNAELERLGLTLHNMGDIAEQTVAGAVSTGTHGSGGTWAGLGAQVVGLELVTGTGEVVVATPTENADVLDLARVSLGALGVLTRVTLAVEPLLLLEAVEQPMTWDEAIGSLDALLDENHHVDLHWFPHTDRLLTKRDNRLDADLDEARPLGRARGWVDDELLANTVFGGVVALGNRVPALVPTLNRVAARALSPRTFSDVPHRVLTSPRRVRFREMEYAVPRAAGPAVLAEVRRTIAAADWRIGFPVEIRAARADDVPLSTAYGRDSLYLAFHVPAAVDHTAYFAGVEPVLRAHDGRPHWGKLHTRTAADLAPAYPRFDDFLALRERLDPDRVLANAYTRRVLGD